MRQIDKAGIKWTLSRIDTNYQWYRSNGTWQLGSHHDHQRQVADGTVDAKASGPVTHRGAGHLGRVPARSREHAARAQPPRATSSMPATITRRPGRTRPTRCKVALDKPAYKIGETANLKLDPQFAGTALVMVVDDRIIEMHAVEVPEGGTTVPLTVSESWGPGAYVTADPLSPVRRGREADAGACAGPCLRRRRSGRPSSSM